LFTFAIAFAAIGFVLSLWLRDPAREPGEPSRGFFTAIRERALVPIWAIGMCFSTAIVAYFAFMKTFVLETHVGSVGLFFSLYSISAVVIRLALGRLPDRFGPKRVLFPALAMLAIGFSLLATTTEAGVAIAGVLCGLGHGFTFPILLGMVVSRTRPSERGAALALYSGLFDAGTLVGGPMFGLVISHAGYPTMFACAGSLVVAGSIGFALSD
jgi:predicted MFS family arabinose efflux permease